MNAHHLPAGVLRCLAIALFFVNGLVPYAQDALFEFTGKDPDEPKNWQKPLNWNLNGEPAARVPGTGPDDRVVIGGSAVTNPGHTVKTLTLGGSITGGFLNVSQSLLLAGGAFKACTVTILDHATFTSSASGLNAFESCIVYNRGVFSPGAVGLGALPGEPSTVLHNDPLTGRIELQDGSFIGSVADGSIQSAGLIVKLNGPGSAKVAGVVLVQQAAGSVECQGGTLQLGLPNPTPGRFVCDRPIVALSADAVVEINGAASELQSGARISGPGKVLVRHALVSGSISVENMEIPSSGVLEGPGEITLLGLLVVNGGSLLGAVGETSPGARLLIENTGTLRFAPHPNGALLGRNVQNSGLVLQEMGASPGHPFGDVISPAFENLPAGIVTLSSSGGLGPRTLRNEGIIRKVINTDMASNQSLSRGCENIGLIDIQTGLLRFFGYTQSAGELRVAAGAEARFQGAGASISGGIVSGSGTIRGISSSSPIVLAGAIRPGSPFGSMTLISGEGSTTLAPTANIEIDIGGPNPGVDYDQVVLNSSFGGFPLAGSISVNLVNGFLPSPGQIFTVIRYAPGRSGAFSSFSGLASAPGILLVPRYANSGLDLVATPDPHLRISTVSESTVSATCQTAAGAIYQFETSTDLNDWSSVGNPVVGDGQTHDVRLDVAPSPIRFFRLRIL